MQKDKHSTLQAYIVGKLEAGGRSIAELRAAYAQQLRAAAQLDMQDQQRALAASGRLRRPRGSFAGGQAPPADMQTTGGPQSHPPTARHDTADSAAGSGSSTEQHGADTAALAAATAAAAHGAAIPPGAVPPQPPPQPG